MKFLVLAIVLSGFALNSACESKTNTPAQKAANSTVQTGSETPEKLSESAKNSAVESPGSAQTAAPVAALTLSQRGRIVFAKCKACHTLEEGVRHSVGPNLWGIMGQKAGHREDFAYSKAMSASEIIWSDETISAYLEKPSSYIPGNRMSSVGLKKAEDREAVIAYIREKTMPQPTPPQAD